ncbi:redoxin domain-containing protein [Flavihumibacter fluvii]|uniref:redoxin domain-containing protein n=1 Tax=Flavihumibacter fluvii TaxID=2838157 RepID=UPI001BDE2C75|nr:redoxin domain-containing protein [Flavihumibacter fluvii]ULQ54394.1 redoxin domain-containing protein [Flavihumibacter fluvii]
MKLFLVIFSLVFATLSAHCQTDPFPIGSRLPKATIKMKDVSGKLISLADIKTNNGLLVIFGSNNCMYMVKNQQRLRDICTYGQKKNIGVVVMNSNEGQRTSDDSYQSMQQYAAAQGYKWPYLLDSNNELADAFSASRGPECYLFNGKGLLVYHGAIDDNPVDDTKIKRRHLFEAMNEMLSNKDILIKESRSIGCSIERKN